MREIVIDGRRVADDEPAFVIAEIGCNHGGSLATALEMIRSAAASGASAIKLQKRDNASLYVPFLLDAPYVNEHSYGDTYGAHRAALEFDADAYAACKASAALHRITWFATAFDEPSVDFLVKLDVPAIKIASGGLTDHALLRYAAHAGKPILLSTGGGILADIHDAVDSLGHCPHAILHATASYPLKPEEANLRFILTLRTEFPSTVIGFSSHSPGIALSLIACAFGARIIEQHVTLDRASKGTDHAFSLEPKGLSTLVDDLRKVQLAFGDGVKRYYPSELGPISKMRRRRTPDGMQITGSVDRID